MAATSRPGTSRMLTRGSTGVGAVSIVYPLGHMKVTRQPSGESTCCTGTVISIFSLCCDCWTGAVMSIFVADRLPPAM